MKTVIQTGFRQEPQYRNLVTRATPPNMLQNRSRPGTPFSPIETQSSSFNTSPSPISPEKQRLEPSTHSVFRITSPTISDDKPTVRVTYPHSFNPSSSPKNSNNSRPSSRLGTLLEQLGSTLLEPFDITTAPLSPLTDRIASNTIELAKSAGIIVLEEGKENEPPSTNKVEIESPLPPIKPGYSRLIHGTSKESAKSIEEDGVLKELFVTPDASQARQYAKGASKSKPENEVLVILEFKTNTLEKHRELGQFFVQDATVVATIPVSDVNTEENQAILRPYKKQDESAFNEMAGLVATLASTPVLVDAANVAENVATKVLTWTI